MTTDTIRNHIHALDELHHAKDKLTFINNAIDFRKLHELTSTAGLWYIINDIEDTIEKCVEALSKKPENDSLKLAA